MKLITDPHLQAPDDFYEALIDTHRDLSVEASHALNARLVLLLANHIGSTEVLLEALQAARACGPTSLASAPADTLIRLSVPSVKRNAPRVPDI